MITIGVTGGVGAGKSEVLSYLEEHFGASCLRLDDVTRDMLLPGQAGYRYYVDSFGKEVLLEDGSLDKTKAAAFLFGNPKKKAEADNFFRPYVQEEVRRRKEAAFKENVKFFVIESAILLEEHYDAFCDELWYIYADEDTRYSRLMAARGYTKERIANMMNRQLSDQVFRIRCDFILDNSGSLDHMKSAVDARLRHISDSEKE